MLLLNSPTYFEPSIQENSPYPYFFPLIYWPLYTAPSGHFSIPLPIIFQNKILFIIIFIINLLNIANNHAIYLQANLLHMKRHLYDSISHIPKLYLRSNPLHNNLHQRELGALYHVHNFLSIIRHNSYHPPKLIYLSPILNSEENISIKNFLKFNNNFTFPIFPLTLIYASILYKFIRR